jgi:hypothetical protein
MRHGHLAGERMFVDYAGTTLEVIDCSSPRSARRATHVIGEVWAALGETGGSAIGADQR